MKKIITLAIGIMFCLSESNAQQWGLYTLYCPQGSATAYLIDTMDTPVNFKTWTFGSTYKTGYSTYFTSDKKLIRTIQKSSNPIGGGGGLTGAVHISDWAGNTLWYWEHSTTNYCLHHDICPLPNGNILMISYEVKTGQNAIDAGCSSCNTTTKYWSEKIIEVQPTSATAGNIVWEWHLWDHICQNVSSSKPNYVTSIVQNPHLMNINYKITQDWWHMNGIDYNAELDQIVISSHNMNEIYVIDHSTTTAEAAGHTGGNYGKGGDFLYRWGNPAAYGATGTANFNVVHDAHWVPSDNPNYPNYLAGFNNKGGTGGKSAVDIIKPPYDTISTNPLRVGYIMTPGVTTTPATYAYRHNCATTATNESNSVQLPNGNMLACVMGYRIYEINAAGTVLWYKTMSGMTGSASQAQRYSKCYVRGPVVTASVSDATVCLGESATLSSTATSVTETSPTYSYNWNSNSGFSSTEQNPVISPTSSGIYNVTITNTAIGCSSSASVEVNVYPQPATPTVSNNGGTLTSSQADAYQWFLNGNSIPGANSQSYIPTATGLYSVQTSDANGCTAMSAQIDVTETNILEKKKTEIKIYPNPTNGLIFIQHDLNPEMKVECKIFSLLGENVISFINEDVLDLSNLNEGIYYLEVRLENEKITGKRIILIK